MKNDLLFHLLYRRAFHHNKEQPFQLTSGKESPYYIDCKTVSLDPQGSFLIGEAIFHRIQSLPVEGVGGMTLGADPIATAVSLVSFIKKKPIPAFIVRKGPKSHGSGKQVEGPLGAHAKLIVVEDVVTTGGSTLKVLSILRAAGHTVLSVIALVDRLEGGREAITATGVPFESLYTLNDFMKAEGPSEG